MSFFATNTIADEGCWTYTNNFVNSGKARYIVIDDFSKNSNTHLISSGDFTAELYLKIPQTPTTVTRILCENSGSKTTGTLDFRVEGSAIKCTLVSQASLEAYDSGETSAAASITLSTPIDNIVGGAWHHVALVVDRTRQTVTLYVDREPVATQSNFVLASSVSTYAEGYKGLKIGDGWGGNNAMGFQNMSIDEFRITRRALAPQEFLMAGAAVDQTSLDPTRAWIGFEGDLSVEPSDGAIPAGQKQNSVNAVFTNAVYGNGKAILDGNGNVLRASNTNSMYFSGSTSSTAANKRLKFDRNLLLEGDMTAMTVEFFMKGTKNEAVAWAYLLRMYGNSTCADTGGERLWSIGYKNDAGALYILMDNGPANANWQLYYPDDSVSFADDRWHHVAVTFEPNGSGNTLCKVYRDYKQVGTTKTYNGLMKTGADFGYSCLGVGAKYNGYLDEVRISKGVLTVDQMMHVIKRGTMISIQ